LKKGKHEASKALKAPKKCKETDTQPEKPDENESPHATLAMRQFQGRKRRNGAKNSSSKRRLPSSIPN